MSDYSKAKTKKDIYSFLINSLQAGFITSLDSDLKSLNVQKEDWDTAFGWGDHSDDINRLDSDLTSLNITNWDDAFSWGDHGTAGYALSADVTTGSNALQTSIDVKWTQDDTKISNWDSAVGWGDHSLAGYLTTVTSADVTAHQADLSITESQISDLAHFSGNYNDLTNKPAIPDITALTAAINGIIDHLNDPVNPVPNKV